MPPGAKLKYDQKYLKKGVKISEVKKIKISGEKKIKLSYDV